MVVHDLLSGGIKLTGNDKSRPLFDLSQHLQSSGALGLGAEAEANDAIEDGVQMVQLEGPEQ